jgi:flagellar hook-basal body complex protein FliE
MQINSLNQNLGIFDSLNKINSNSQTDANGNASTSANSSFTDTLKAALDNVNDKQLQSDSLTESFIKGDNVDVQQVMIASAEAKQSLEMAVQVRNKLMDAFQEINKLQL